MNCDEYEAIFNPDKIEFRSRNEGISSLMEITVSPEENVEIRRISLTNISNRPRKLTVTSFGEVALTSAKGDASHPAFSKLFVASEYLPEYDAILFERRPRTEHDQRLFLVHLLSSSVVWAPTEFDTSRATFIGRGGNIREPRALTEPGKLAGSLGSTLDPVFSLRHHLELDMGQSGTVSFITAAASSRNEAMLFVRKYREGQHVSRAFEMAWSHSHVEIRHQQFSISGVLDFQHLANAIIYNIDNLRGPSDTIRRSTAAQSALWRIGISGDEPIVLAVVTDPEQNRFIQELLLGHEYLRQRGLKFDLVILNEFVSGYMQDFQEELQTLMRASASRDSIDQRGGVFLRSSGQMSAEEIDLLYSAARVVLSGNRGPLSGQLVIDSSTVPSPGSATKTSTSRKELPRGAAASPPAGELSNGIGSFVENGKAYQMVVTDTTLPPAPWVNVVANERFGFIASEAGGGFTWSQNSRENRMSVWTNDPIQDRPSEVIYLRDLDSGALWCPTPRPVPHRQPVVVTHRFGSTSYAANISDIGSELTLSGDLNDSVKYFHLKLENPGSEERRLVIAFYIEWVLGFSRPDSYRHLRVGWEQEQELLYATNPYNVDFGRQVAFIGSSHPIATYTAKRAEFLGRNHSLSLPAALAPGAGVRVGRGKITRSSGLTLSKQTGGGFDSCGVICVRLTLPPGQSDQVLFYLGAAETIAQAKEQAPRFRSLKTREKSLEEVRTFWNETTTPVQLETPDRSFDILANGWLLYQTLACRMFARSGFYQSSGAMGFRDQLQDSMALLLGHPERTRKQILLHASRQFREGDVQHWWHPPVGRGVRTRITDNYLWLPYVVLEYLRITGDRTILDEQVSFLEGPQLEGHQNDLYFQPTVSNESGTLAEHCRRALERGFAVGPRGVPLIGGGDWNDGMNEVGLGYKGESIWLGWFFADVLKRAALHLIDPADDERRARYNNHADQVIQAIESSSWDGEWYQRATFDDGTPLGSQAREECRIDSIAQSWAVISRLGNKDRALKAMSSVYEHLVDDELRLVKLLAPPFVASKPSPGYIQSYPAGLRENGGQYTHAATWVVIAATMLGDGEKAFSLFQYLNPLTHTATKTGVARYKTEPYVLCGDVYTNHDHPGRGGWSWYSGSSGWLYRAAIEHIAGLRLTGDSLEVVPCIPPSWPGFRMTLRLRGMVFRVTVENPAGISCGTPELTLNGKAAGNSIPLAECRQDNEILVSLRPAT